MMPRTPNSKEVLDQALRLALGEYVKGLIRLEGKPVYQTPRIIKVICWATEVMPDDYTHTHYINIE